MRTAWIRRALFVLALVAAAVALAPAVLLDAPLAMRTERHLRLIDATGFWWRGRAALASADGTARIPVAWRVEVGSLARGVVVVQLRGNETAAVTGTITARDGRVDVQDLRLRAPATAIGAFDPRLRSIALGGRVTLDAPALTSTAAGRTGEFTAVWERARIVAGATIFDLGTVTLAGHRVNGGSEGTIRNDGGNLVISGTVTDRQGALAANLALRPTATAPDTVRNTLPLLGAPDGAGGVNIAWRSAG